MSPLTRFVTERALAEYPGADTPFGSSSLAIELGGAAYIFEGLSDAIRTRLHVELAPLEIERWGANAVRVQVAQGETDWFRPHEYGVEYEVALAHTDQHLLLAGMSLLAELPAGAPRTARLWLEPDYRDFDLSAVHNLLRLLASLHAADAGAVVLHSAGIVTARGAYVFFGRSGSGKSTLSQKSRDAGHLVLSDDLNRVSLDAGGAWVEAQPFAGDLCGKQWGAGRHRLLGLYHLHQGPVAKVRQLSNAAAVSALLAASPYANVDPHRLGRLLSTLEQLAQAVPTCTLHTPASADFWFVIEPAATQE